MARTAITLQPFSTAETELDLKEGAGAVALSSILLRRDGDTRKIDAARTLMLAESIAATGLLFPVVVAETGRLLAGSHRLAALQLLAIEDPEARVAAFDKRLEGTDAGSDSAKALRKRVKELDGEAFKERFTNGKVPVMVIGVGDDEHLALAIETGENVVRKEYTAKEIQNLAKLLGERGFTRKAGKPKEGEKSMIRALEAMVGRSQRHIKALLSVKPAKDESEPKKALANGIKALKRAVSAIDAAFKADGNLKRSKIGKRAAEIVQAVEGWDESEAEE